MTRVRVGLWIDKEQITDFIRLISSELGINAVDFVTTEGVTTVMQDDDGDWELITQE